MAEVWLAWKELRRWWVRRAAKRQGKDVFHTFNQEVRDALVAAQDEAQRRGTTTIEPGHLLLGLLAEERGVAAWALGGVGVDPVAVRTEVESTVGPVARRPATGETGLGSAAKRVVALAVVEGQRLGDAHVGPEHLLLDVARHGDSTAAILTRLGGNSDRLRSFLGRAANRQESPAAR